MKPEYFNGKIVAYSIGEDIRIHSHVDDPDYWFFTIREAEIYSERLCSKQNDPVEIARIICLELRGRADKLNDITKEVMPFTYR